MTKINDLLKAVFDSGSSDLHLVVGSQPSLRTHGRLSFISSEPVLDAATTSQMVLETMTPEQKERFLTEKEWDYSYAIPGVARFRVNAYTQKGSVAGAFRLIPEIVPSIDDLKLPTICHTFAQLHQGFILVTGPTSQGKSSTLAAIIEEINVTRAEHIITIEDPVEFVYQNKKSIISQREVGNDTKSFARALRSSLREDPNVVLVGEMRDLETMSAAMTTAETGHLVFATLHTNSASQTVDRVIDSFPEEQQEQIRSQLSTSLEAVFSQRLIPTKDGKRIVAVEVMVSTPAIKSNIREGKTHQIDNVIQTSQEMGMILLESSIANLVNRGVVDKDVAYKYANHPAVLARLIGEIK
ncbi:type IV pili twitching motility protein PilT [Candidatus Collierbacteria bacterium RIFCSPLOWO2_01_FULL_50_23]|uniref:Type IV pili twitching motility protein PilT n=2 Tax=Candidatus Collieribacteriota TaxID=1752725 RepID=A0A1F5EW89_9BACT|nr:MAG: type IV pili twitching motility protein PilT [Candidatus Collierbacteria bacterium RIFCSPHIGHO2_01_FULL_50_25]OGD71645.1 MAG: type IV pili twitching motility protein PilT [Candidatus Collierbacteria bacterium RIFCSPHIGHO2_02_FULL_49_10]OGD73799.1 MAG: type IV pili twitching motility protein PilT [Candidatus Collierbacteria bacterium RIFCSPLOWO2_01_FULL_50_23]